MNRLICAAIETRRLIRFDYDGFERTVEPYAHGFNPVRREVLRGYQVAGGSRSGVPIGWKFFVVANMDRLELLSRPFRPVRPRHEHADHNLIVIHCTAMEGMRPAG